MTTCEGFHPVTEVTADERARIPFGEAGSGARTTSPNETRKPRCAVCSAKPTPSDSPSGSTPWNPTAKPPDPQRVGHLTLFRVSPIWAVVWQPRAALWITGGDVGEPAR